MPTTCLIMCGNKLIFQLVAFPKLATNGTGRHKHQCEKEKMS